MSQETPASRAATPARTVIVHRGELDYLSRCILDFPGIETGGELFGFWTASGVPVVLYVIGPGPRANHEPAFFNQDLAYLRSIGNRLIRAYGLQHIGEWHSHHRLGLAKPSGHDARTMVRSIEADGLGRFLLCIANVDDSGSRSSINAYAFHQDAGYDYRLAAWDVKDGESPYRSLVDRDPELAGVLVHPTTKEPAMGEIPLAAATEQLIAPQYGEDYWLNTKANNLVLKRILDFLSETAPTSRCAPALDAENRVVVAVDRPNRRETILFPERFPLEPPVLGVEAIGSEGDRLSLFFRLFGAKRKPEESPATFPDAPVPPESGAAAPAPVASAWVFTGDIFLSFTNWYRAVLPQDAGPQSSLPETPAP